VLLINGCLDLRAVAALSLRLGLGGVGGRWGGGLDQGAVIPVVWAGGVGRGKRAAIAVTPASAPTDLRVAAKSSG
jgi:hypothetical protein